MSCVPNIQWLDENITDIEYNPAFKEKFELLLQENPLSSVYDREEENIQINRFAIEENYTVGAKFILLLLIRHKNSAIYRGSQKNVFFSFQWG